MMPSISPMIPIGITPKPQVKNACDNSDKKHNDCWSGQSEDKFVDAQPSNEDTAYSSSRLFANKLIPVRGRSRLWCLFVATTSLRLVVAFYVFVFFHDNSFLLRV